MSLSYFNEQGQEIELQYHIRFLRLAITEARKCIPTKTAFCVGCVLVCSLPGSTPTLFATGYSRELEGNTHAEANALAKAEALTPVVLSSLFPNHPNISLQTVLSHTDVYTTLEPCSVRTSGLSPCANALITAKVRRCFIGVSEPKDFVECEGARRLEEAGIQVVWLEELQEECLSVARTGHNMHDAS